jgi:signal transduction histidine kinase
MSARETVDDPVALGSQALADALEQQAATAEILRIISRSPADAQPVFDTIAAAALKLCAARSANVFTYDGTLLHIAALAIVDAQGIEAMRSIFPRPASNDSAACRAVLTRSVVAIPDVLADAGFVTRHAAVAAGFRSSLGVPLMRDGEPIGAIAVGRAEPGSFPTSQIALLQTFAEQAVMAIENMRLFKERDARNRELAEALEHQTATGEILRVLSQIPNDVQPVFEAIVNTGVRLFKGAAVAVSRHHAGQVHPMAIAEDDPERAARWRKVFPFPLSREYIHGAAILDCRVVDVADVLVMGGQFEAGKRNLAPSGYRAMTVVPLVREGVAIGAIAVVRMAPGTLSAKQIALLQTFANQAVIAIENVRLFNETQEALAHQTATGDVLQVISGSMANAKPVFEKILDSCEHLFGATDLGVFLADGQERLSVAAYRSSFADWAPGAYPRPLAGTMSEMVMRRGALVHWGDVAQASDIPDYVRDVVHQGGNFAVAVAPLVWQGQGIGTIDVMRKPPRAYSEKELALLATFADQAVIAIQNAQRFNETQDALARQTATSEVLRVISGSVTDTQPVFDVIAERASRLTGANSGWVFTFDGEWIRGASAFGLTPEALTLALSFFPMRPSGGSYTARAIRDGTVVNVADALAETDPEYATKPVARAAGYRSVLSVPMLRGREVIGAISVNRADVGRFGDKEVELLRTFADQAVIAIENVRLFNELQHKTQQLEVAGRHKSAFLANMSHELRTPLNAILGFTRIVLRETRERIDRKQADNLEKILASARHLVGLINATLDLTRIEAGRIEITAGEIALAPLLDECLRSVEPLLSDGVALDCHIAPNLPPMRVDAEKLRQIVINLLSNAVKFTERGRIDVRAHCRGNRVDVEVTDSGIGVPADKLEAIFEEFEQVDASHTRAHGGTGLGLAIARRLARAMGGELSARSALGAGSSFLLDLPLRYREPDEA